MDNRSTLNEEVSRKFTYLSWGSILIVVLFHSDLRYFSSVINDLAVVSTSYFFCISAFFFYRGANGRTMAVRLKKRCITLLLPYFLWNSIYMILILLMNGKDSFSLSNVIRGFTVTPLCIPSWYLLTLFIFLIPAPLIKRAFDKTYSTVVLLALSVLIAWLGYLRFPQELAAIPFVGEYLIRMTMYLFPHLIGAVTGVRFHEKIYVGRKNCILGITGSFALIFLLLCDIPGEIRWLSQILLMLSLWEAVPEKLFRMPETVDRFRPFICPPHTAKLISCPF